MHEYSASITKRIPRKIPQDPLLVFWCENSFLELAKEIPHGSRCPGFQAVIRSLAIGGSRNMAAVEGNVLNRITSVAVLEIVFHMGFTTRICLGNGIGASRHIAAVVFCMERCAEETASLLAFITVVGASAIAHTGNAQVSNLLLVKYYFRVVKAMLISTVKMIEKMTIAYLKCKLKCHIRALTH